MKRIYIVVEGQTEQEFVNCMIAPYLLEHHKIYNVTPVLVRTSRSGRGGMINFQHLYNTVIMLLQSSQTDFIVTTFIDFFRIPHTMPLYDCCMAKPNDTLRIEALEEAMNEHIADSRFFSYIQLHEFEALLFSNNKGFESFFTDDDARQTSAIIAAYENPEDINSSPEGAPSKRLLRIKPDYNKVLEGNLIALEIGINGIQEKCPRFAQWIERMIERCEEKPSIIDKV